MRTKTGLLLLAFMLFCMVNSASGAVNGDSLMRTIADNKWKALPYQGGPFPPITYNVNIIVDSDSNRLFMWGSDLTLFWNYNTVFMLNLSTLVWKWAYPNDAAASYKKLKSGVFGDTSKFWAYCSTGHPVPSYSFDAVKYIPGKSCILLNQFPDHNDSLVKYLFPGQGLTSSSCRSCLGEPASWLFDTKTLRWKQLVNAPVPNPWECPMGVSSDGETVIQLDPSGNTYEFRWSDSTWVKVTTSGTSPVPANSCLEYDTYLKKFICVGGTTYNYHAYDPATHVWENLNIPKPLEMSGCHTGYDTLNHVMIAQVPYGTTAGYSSTIVVKPGAAKWDTVRYVGQSGAGYIPPYEGFSFKGEYDKRSGLFFYMKDRDLYGYRYKGAPIIANVEKNNAADQAQLTATPNPFKPATLLSFSVDKPAKAVLRIFSVTGQQVAVLHNGLLGAGRHDFGFRGTDNLGTPVAGGVYVARLELDGRTFEKRLMLMH